MGERRSNFLPWRKVAELHGLTAGKRVDYLKPPRFMGPAVKGTVKDIEVLKLGPWKIAERIFLEDDTRIPSERIVPDNPGHGVF